MSAAPHVLVVNVFFAPNTYGGATIVAEEVARRLVRDHGARVTAISAISRADIEPYGVLRAETGGIQNHMINLPPGRSYAEQYRNPQVAERVAAIARAAGPDLAHLHCLQEIGADAIGALRAEGLPVILSVHDFWWLCERQFMLRPDARYCGQDPVRIAACRGCVDDWERARTRHASLAAAAAEADAVTYPSRFARDLCERSGLAPGRGVVWENGVRLPGPGFREAQAARRARDGRLAFGYVGGPSAIKGWPVMRAAFAGLGRRDFRGVLVEGGRAGEWWRGRVPAGLAGDWEIVPRYAQEEMDAFYAGIDVLVFLSQWKETFGLAIREALARGIRVIQTDSGGTMEHAGAALTRVVPIGSGPEALRAALAAELDAGPRPARPVPVTGQAEQAAAFLRLAAEVLAGRGPGAAPAEGVAPGIDSAA